MPQRLHDTRVSIAHGRQVAGRPDIRHRKLRPLHFLHDRSEDDERPRVVQPDVRGICDDANHFDVTTLRFAYADGRSHNAEALLVHPKTGRLYVVTKNSSGGAVYRAPAQLRTGAVNILTKVADAPASYLATVLVPPAGRP